MTGLVVGRGNFGRMRTTYYLSTVLSENGSANARVLLTQVYPWRMWKTLCLSQQSEATREGPRGYVLVPALTGTPAVERVNSLTARVCGHPKKPKLLGQGLHLPVQVLCSWPKRCWVSCLPFHSLLLLLRVNVYCLQPCLLMLLPCERVGTPAVALLLQLLLTSSLSFPCWHSKDLDYSLRFLE